MAVVIWSSLRFFLSSVLKFKRTYTNCITSFHIKMLEIITIQIQSTTRSYFHNEKKPREKRYIPNSGAEQESC